MKTKRRNIKSPILLIEIESREQFENGLMIEGDGDIFCFSLSRN